MSLLDTGSLLEGRRLGLALRRLARYGRSIVCDQDFADCYAHGRGRPSIPPSTLMLAFAGAARRDLGPGDRRAVSAQHRWKTALGLPIDHPGFHPTAFSVFRSRILLHDKDEALFRVVVRRASEAGVLPRRGLQLIDSSPIMGAAAVLDNYELEPAWASFRRPARVPESPSSGSSLISSPRSLTTHDLRHTAVILALSTGAPLKAVQAHAGHVPQPR
jgi:hypothetical protein